MLSEVKKDRALLLSFALANSAALIFQVAWVRSLMYVFGSSVYAISTVLVVFMSGLAFGSYLFGRFVDYNENPTRLFSLIQSAIGIYGLVTLILFNLILDIYLAFGGGLPIKVILAFISLIGPTTLIGGAFPTFARAYSGKRIGREVGTFYAVDTLSAGAGAILAGFALLPLLGIRSAIILASLFCFAASILSRSYSQSTLTLSRREAIAEHGVLLAFFMSGFAALVNEVTLTRLLSLILGTSTYALSVVLASFLIGLGVGSYVMGKKIEGIQNLYMAFAGVEMGIAMSIALLLFGVSRFDVPYLMLRETIGSFYPFYIALLFLVFIALLIPTALMGATMPLAAEIVARKNSLGRDVGYLFSVNTLGGVFGSFAAGFLLLPRAGSVKSVFVAVAINAVVALYFARKSGKALSYPMVVLFLVIAPFILSSDVNLRAGGVYYNTMGLSLEKWNEIKREREFLYQREGLYGYVGVVKSKEDLILAINGKPDASTETSDASLQKLLAHVPLLLHSEPKGVLNIGLGSGITLGAIESHDVEEITLLEIDPLVVEAAEFFSDFNGDALDDSRVKLIVGDARDYLLRSDKKFDAIISEPSNPWVQGEAGLFTREFYEIVKERMQPGGVFSQWIPIFEKSGEEFAIALKTFNSVFPYVSVWWGGSDIILIGSEEPLRLDYKVIMDKIDENPMVWSDFEYAFGRELYGSEAVEFFFVNFFMGGEEIRRYAESAPLNTDDRPRLEYRTAKNAVYRPPVDAVASVIKFKNETYGAPITIPPVINIITRSDDEVFLDFLKAKVALSEGWRETFTGFRIRHYHVVTARSYVKEAEFVKGNTTLTINVYESRAFATLGDSPGVELFIDAEVKEILESKIEVERGLPVQQRGEMNINGETGYLVLGALEDHEAKSLAVGWFCTNNQEIYTLTVDYLQEDPEIFETVQTARCVA